MVFLVEDVSIACGDTQTALVVELELEGPHEHATEPHLFPLSPTWWEYITLRLLACQGNFWPQKERLLIIIDHERL
jgi:hypothetical protein